MATSSVDSVLVQFDVARASCACIHGRDARATFSNCTSTRRLCIQASATKTANPLFGIDPHAFRKSPNNE